MSASLQHDNAWCQLSGDLVIQKLSTSFKGLTASEVSRRQIRYGKNILPEQKVPSIAAVIFRQFLSPLVYILLAAAGIAFALGNFNDGWFVLIAVGINTSVGAWQELKAEKNAAALRKLLRIMVLAKRDGVTVDLTAEELVPGDIVLLAAGNKVPADIRLLSERNITINESLLTGESTAVEKVSGSLTKCVTIGEHTNMVFTATTVMTGRGEGVVIATGINTEVGKIAKAIATTKAQKTPLIMRMERFTMQIGLIIMVLCSIVAALALSKGIPYHDVFFLVVALAVAAIPEGLPVAVTVALSVASTRMARRQVIVRKLTAVEGLGSCTMIASDKTGTLTVNAQTARRIVLPSGEVFNVSGEGYDGVGAVQVLSGKRRNEAIENQLRALAEAGALCNEAELNKEQGKWKHRGDAIDIAFLALAYKIQIQPIALRQSIEKLGEIAYESEKRHAAILYRKGRYTHIALKGAVETVLQYCKNMRHGDKEIPLNVPMIRQAAIALAESGHRVLAVAQGKGVAPKNKEVFSEKDVKNLSLLGLVGFIDPLRPEAAAAVSTCRSAGIDVVMITGDHPATALAIAVELGIAEDKTQVITGERIAAAGEKVMGMLPDFRVFAEVSPVQKLQIVDALLKSGHFVAVTGDGVNDGPALRRASIGVAMGSGTDVAKETSSLIIADDNFASIVSGVEEGRFANENVRKVIYLLVSTGFAEIILFILSLATGLPLPLFAAQILWLNLVTNGVQDMGLAFEAGEPGVMSRRPQPSNEGLFNRLLVNETIISGLYIGLTAFGIWSMLIKLGIDESVARNALFLLMVLFENIHAMNCRSERLSIFSLPFKRNPYLMIGIVVSQLVHIMAMYIPATQKVLGIQPVSFSVWMTLLGIAASLLLVMEVYKALWRRLERRGAV
ncbi:MAG: ATPase [Candidatus Magasanikbacteria bacterium RIFCSPLOWO2_02_FULL_44_11]|uniref:P-type Cu(+) transporter n=1 Tax=Candidatus Magasanikbacteria bacterium RIFCSPLOWO2_02_FULL_44_11 TaxID=1798689 RepID=A0A1F6NBF8_9BACT|nr:MAG: ATPase [Candidatus Magasanikbacteria bacterium RIFCSPLOWO2_02_FULL_44_11]